MHYWPNIVIASSAIGTTWQCLGNAEKTILAGTGIFACDPLAPQPKVSLRGAPKGRRGNPLGNREWACLCPRPSCAARLRGLLRRAGDAAPRNDNRGILNKVGATPCGRPSEESLTLSRKNLGQWAERLCPWQGQGRASTGSRPYKGKRGTGFTSCPCGAPPHCHCEECRRGDVLLHYASRCHCEEPQRGDVAIPSGIGNGPAFALGPFALRGWGDCFVASGTPLLAMTTRGYP